MRRNRLMAALSVLVIAGGLTVSLATPASAWSGNEQVFGTPGTNGWYVSDVTVNFSFSPSPVGSSDPGIQELLTGMNCSVDGGAESSFGSPPYQIVGYRPLSGGVTVTTDGVHTASCNGWGWQRTNGPCFSLFGCVHSDWTPFSFGRTRQIAIDRTRPVAVLTPIRTPDSNGWYNHPFSANLSGSSDPAGGSGLRSCTFGNIPGNPFWGGQVTGITGFGYSGPETAGSTAVGGCTDMAGNASFSVGMSIRYDATAPTLAPAIVPAGVLPLNSSAVATANATDALSRIASQGCGAVDTSAVGSFTVACTATDRAGNTTTTNVPYTVGYIFDGFAKYSSTSSEVVTAGRAIPLKFKLSSSTGPVTDLATFALSSAPCDDSSAVTEEFASGASGLQNMGDGTYQVNWNTSKAYAGQCRVATMTLGNDPTPHAVTFQFK